MVEVKIYVEGGGDQRDVSARCRKGFSEFFAKLLPSGKKPAVIVCGSRSMALDSFRIALRQNPDRVNLLLIDSERPVADDVQGWGLLAQHDKWLCPDGATDKHLHLMVQGGTTLAGRHPGSLDHHSVANNLLPGV